MRCHGLVRNAQQALRILADVHVYITGAAWSDDIVRLVHRPLEAKLRSDLDLRLAVEQYCRVEMPSSSRARRHATIIGYSYSVLTARGQTGPNDREIFAYHYHPALTPDVPFPHMHVHWNRPAGEKPISKCHFPTGHIALEDFLRLLIRDFSAQPRVSNWEAVFTRTASSQAQ